MNSKIWCRLFTIAGLVAMGLPAAVVGQDGKSSIPAVSASEMKDWMRQLTDSARGASSSTDQGNSLALLEKMRFYLGASDNIVTFRLNDDQKVISRLATLASADDAGLRYNAASILANVADNTTLCVVLEKILDRSIDVAARFNLLQTAKVVSTFSTRDNTYWIRSTVNQIRSWSEGRKDSDRTLQVLSQIEQSLDNQREQFRATSLLVLAPTQYRECIELSTIAAFETARKAYTVHVHTKRPAPDTDKLKAVLTEAGFSYGGVDESEDPAGGRAIDYSTQGNRKTNQDVAQFVADTINAHFFRSPPLDLSSDLKARAAPSPTPEKNLAVWF